MLIHDIGNREGGIPLFCVHTEDETRHRCRPILSKGEWLNQIGVVCTLFYCPACHQVYAWEGIT